MSAADTMPPLPSQAMEVRDPYGGPGALLFYSADQMRAYARNYADAQVSELVAALEALAEAAQSMLFTCVRIRADTPEDDDAYVHERWAEKFLLERVTEARAAIATNRENQC